MGRETVTRAIYERTAELASSAGSVTVARHLLRDDLTEHGVNDQVIEDALLIVSELMGNSVRHARPLQGDSRGRVRLHWTVSEDGEVRVDVTDGGGNGRPRVESQSLADTGGRGLAIVSAVADDWGVAASDEQVTVYAVVG